MDKFFYILMQKASDLASHDGFIHLLPKGEFFADDGRGPFEADEKAIMAAAKGKKLPIDINHAIDIKARYGAETPAIGWIIELQLRDDGFYGRVEWTKKGAEILANKEYGMISPVFLAEKSKPNVITQIARASLVNDPALPQLKALFHKQSENTQILSGENQMEKELQALLGLKEDAKPDDIVAAVKTLCGAEKSHKELMSNLCKVAKLDEATSAEKIVETFSAKMTADSADAATDTDADKGEKTALENKLTELNKELMALKNSQAREKAEIFVGQAIKDGKITPSLKDHYIERFCREPDLVQKEIAATPALFSAGLKNYVPSDATGLSHDEQKICQMMGIDAAEFAKNKKKEII